MELWLWIVPLISAAAGLIVGIMARKKIIATVQDEASRLPQLAGDYLNSVSGAAFEQINPMVEQQIDHFLRVKLGKSMPMISMFIGDKTINQLKKIFMEELEGIFPSVMEKYAESLRGSIAQRVAPLLIEGAGKKLQRLPLAGLLVGAGVGIIQLLAVTVLK